MRKKSLISMVVALSLVAVIMVGATLAYLTDTTEKVVNTFTIGNVDIDLDEPSWKPDNAKDLEPGAEIEKDPTVYNTGKNDAYVAVVIDGMKKMAAAGFAAEVNDGWVLVDENGVALDWDGKTLVDGIYAYSTDMVEAGGETVPVFNKVVFEGTDDLNNTHIIHEIAVDEEDETAGTYFIIDDKTDVHYATYKEAAAAAQELAVEETLSFDLTVQAYAIQTKGFEMFENNAYPWVKAIFNPATEAAE